MDRNWLNKQHRGFVAYREQTEQDPLVNAQRKGTEAVDAMLMDCRVHTDWIEQIEQALPFIENALNQNRQFILRQGETVPLEKAKRVSRESVEHLSKHSELITSDPQQPEKLFITENLDTHAIYENRFLYMLLRYLEDFVGSRYHKIIALSSAFSSEICLEQQLSQGDRQLRFQLHFQEQAQGNASPQNDQTIARISVIIQTVEQLLRTALMKELSAAPILKPPIARTNVLLHEPNFRAAFELYSYLTEYTGDGFEAVEVFRINGSPSEELRSDLRRLMSITSYLSYAGGMGPELEEQRKDAIRRENQQRLEALRQQLGDVSPEVVAYVQALEQQLGILEDKAQRLSQQTALRQKAEAQLETAKGQIRSLQVNSDQLRADIQGKTLEIQKLSQQNAQIQETAELRLRRAELQQEQLRRQFEEKLEHQQQEFQQEYALLGQKYRLASAMSRNLDENCSSKEEFCTLEQEYEAFRHYYQKQWRLAKKQIRKDQLWKKDM